MQSKLISAATLLASLIASTAPAAAQHRGYPYAVQAPMPHPGHRHVRRHAPMLPPGIAYRDPGLDLRPRGQPDFLIRAYLPRFTETPMYNEPPAHFPRW